MARNCWIWLEEPGKDGIDCKMARMDKIAGNGYTMLEMEIKTGNDCKLLELL